MNIHLLLQFILRQRRNAIVAALCLTLLPLFNWLAVIIIAFVTLMKGPFEGFLVLLWVALPYAVLAVKGLTLPLLTNFLLGACVAYLFAIVLLKKGKWSWVLNGFMLLAIAVIVILHLVFPHLTLMWANEMKLMLQQLPQGIVARLLPTNVEQYLIVKAAQFATGIQASFVMVAVMFELFIARALQLSLFAKKRVQQEWLQLHIEYWVIGLLGAVFILAYVGPVLFLDLVPVVLVPFFLVGLSVLSRIFKRVKPAHKWLLVTLFILIALMLPFFLIGLLVLLAILDKVIFHRRKI